MKMAFALYAVMQLDTNDRQPQQVVVKIYGKRIWVCVKHKMAKWHYR